MTTDTDAAVEELDRRYVAQIARIADTIKAELKKHSDTDLLIINLQNQITQLRKDLESLKNRVTMVAGSGNTAR